MRFGNEPDAFGSTLPFLDALRTGAPNLTVGGLRAGSVPFAAATAALEAEGPVLVVVQNVAAVRTMMRDLAFFLAGTDDGGAARIRHYGALDVSPFESISPHIALLARRMSALSSLLDGADRPVVVTPVEALMEKLLPRADFSRRILQTHVDDLLDRDEFADELVKAGYSRAPLTEDYGDFSVRGGIVDLFCPLYERPIRIELDDIEVKSIRFFDPATQVSRTHTQRIRICPARQIVLDPPSIERFSLRIKDLADRLGAPKAKRDQLVEQIDQGIYFPGVEFFVPLFFESLGTVFDYLPRNARVLVVEPGQIEAARDAFHQKVWTRRERAEEAGKLACDVQDLYLDPKAFDAALASTRPTRLGLDAFSDEPNAPVHQVQIADHSGLREQIMQQVKQEEPLAPLAMRIRQVMEAPGRCLLVCSAPSGADRMERMLRPYAFRVRYAPDTTFVEALAQPPGSNKVPILLGELSAGFVLPDKRLAVICEEEVFSEKKRTESVVRYRGEAISGFAELSENDHVVHVIHGVGIYRGLEQLEVAGVQGEYLLLEYARRDKLYLPVDRLSQVQRYVGTGTAPTVDRLGAMSWEKVKGKARAAARQIAGELLRLYAKRAALPGHAFEPPDPSFNEFESNFAFEETADQITAITDVIQDMTESRPMDRLICGDVGFGKTEVALRAAFLAVLSGKQVAVLVPTTTLAFQHYRTFTQRLEPFGVRVEMLSRFTPARSIKPIHEGMVQGKVDVVIGTHKLLAKRVQFAALGLLVIDEEQHFGVIQKEKIRKLKEQVDVLAMTATPIPRTLNMALSGLRDLSIINTPPEDRLAVRTFITPWDEDTLREAMERELLRGGQIFFVHNRIRTIDTIARKVTRLAPKARIRVAHGQMRALQIEQTMIDFAEHRFDILVCTAIIESGLDFPRANTIFLHRADNLGLSQLYQLRGRVGRAKRRAYCYLIIPGDRAITRDARRRLAVLRTFTELGSGYKIAARDLEIRGAGNLLGEQQSGQIAAVGFEMFTQLLEQETRKLQGKQVRERIDPELSLPVPAFLPETYVPEVGQRLALYKRLADAPDLDQALAVREELKDRYGPLPDQVENLIRVMEIKIRARDLMITAIESGPDTLAFKFDDRTPVRPSTLVALVGAEPKRFTIQPDGRLIEKIEKMNTDALFDTLKKTLQQLA